MLLSSGVLIVGNDYNFVLDTAFRSWISDWFIATVVRGPDVTVFAAKWTCSCLYSAMNK